MTKEQFIAKWEWHSKILIADFEAVIATEIAKVKEVKAEPEELKGNCSTFDISRLVDHEQPALNPIAEAYERGEKIRCNYWGKDEWIKKHSKTESITECNKIYKNLEIDFHFATHPEKWEIYTKPTEQPAKPFDRDRFEAMFRAVVMSGKHINDLMATENMIKLLDAYYASKEGGENG